MSFLKIYWKFNRFSNLPFSNNMPTDQVIKTLANRHLTMQTASKIDRSSQKQIISHRQDIKGTDLHKVLGPTILSYSRHDIRWCMTYWFKKSSFAKNFGTPSKYISYGSLKVLKTRSKALHSLVELELCVPNLIFYCSVKLKSFSAATK